MSTYSCRVMKCRRFGTSALYLTYRNETSILIPLPNTLYRNIPEVIKGKHKSYLNQRTRTFSLILIVNDNASIDQ